MQNLLNKAIILATKKHGLQTDKIGKPYILHPLRVMMDVNTMEEKIVAVLHDIVEDTDISCKQLLELGFSSKICNAVSDISKLLNEPYEDYLRRVASNDLSKTVKIADLRDNMSPMRQYMLSDEKQKNLKKKYVKALLYLEGYGYVQE